MGSRWRCSSGATGHGCGCARPTATTAGSTRVLWRPGRTIGPRTGPREPRRDRSAPSSSSKTGASGWLSGRAVAIDPSGAGYNAGDILCFADGRRIAHVALWAGAGHIVHSALARGGVASDDLFADTPAAERLRGMLVAVRRPETSRS